MSIENPGIKAAVSVDGPSSITTDPYFRSMCELIAEMYDRGVPITGDYKKTDLPAPPVEPEIITVVHSSFDAHLFNEMIKAMLEFDKRNADFEYVVASIKVSAGRFGWRLDIETNQVAK